MTEVALRSNGHTGLQRFPSPLALTTFARTARTDAIVAVLVKLLHGRK